MPSIHPTAIVDPSAHLGEDTEVGPYAIIEARADIGDHARIMAHAFVGADTTIGPYCELHLGAAVGGQPQMRIMSGPPGRVRIGAGTVIREYVTIHRATKPDAWTTVGARCFLLATSHVAHDCTLGDEVTLANGALLAGHVTVGDRAFISGNTAVHQFVRIGRLAMIGGLARVPKDVPPFAMVACDGAVYGLNVVGMRRAGMTSAERLEVKRAFHAIYHADLNVSQALEALGAQPASPLTDEIIAFVRASVRGICAGRRRRSREESSEEASLEPSDGQRTAI
jgi:UDP-N-acetylglucosamine acyltransferase